MSDLTTEFEDDDKDTLTPDQIVDRIRNGERFVERGIGFRDKAASRRFLDGSEAAVDLQHDDYLNDMAGVLPTSQEVGAVNYLAINILVKVASIAIADPDWHIEHPDPNAADSIQKFLRQMWKKRHWARICRKALFKRSLSGMGCIAVLWDVEHKEPSIEHVKVKDLSVDPNVIDWHRLRWGARRIRLPREEAQERWPGENFDATIPTIPNVEESSAAPAQTVEVWCYWDKDTEAIIYGSEILEQGPNHYGRVPLVFLEGDLAPESEFSLGDYDTSTGLQTQLARLSGLINNAAESGGAIGWYNPTLLDDASKDSFANGRPEGFVGVNAASGAEVFGYVSAEPMSQIVMEAFTLAQQGLDAATGVSEYQRGVLTRQVQFATQAALLANQSGSRGTAAQMEYEQFLDEIVQLIVQHILSFGAASVDMNDDADVELYQSLAAVTDICAIERSTSYKDPSYEMQAATQLATVLLPFIEAGVVNPAMVAIDILRAWGKRNPERYIQQQQTSAPGVAPPALLPPGAAPSVAGQVSQPAVAPASPQEQLPPGSVPIPQQGIAAAERAGA